MITIRLRGKDDVNLVTGCDSDGSTNTRSILAYRRKPSWTSSVGPVLTRGMAWIMTAMMLFVLAACSDDSSELTTHEMLEKLEGRPLTAAEVEERVALADLLCGFENRVLARVWDRLDLEQLEFQDWVFGYHCPDKLTAYTQARPNIGTVPVAPITDAGTDADADSDTDGDDGSGRGGDDTTDNDAPFDNSVLEGIERTPATYPELN